MCKTTTPLDRLRQSYGMAALPDSIGTEAFGEFGRPVDKPIAQATVDDVAFAIQALNDESAALYRRLDALRRLHDHARRAGGLGTALAVEAALRSVEAGR
ncbi:hypothetical protein GCM10010964_28530 [Caldovatus sediminis]|uniref:Uncharacterized protein n=1 Tax=Caldovatus sediminis TaxID=2041189 RepID=A0A8J2ZD41_9PROT|nr:hypothetical protein [Caldovatus sediminis]GGG39267.1 hypothetical protein GCM10010964_28530 [Caldovatus sediminis]